MRVTLFSMKFPSNFWCFNPNWHEGGHFSPLVFFGSVFVSWIFITSRRPLQSFDWNFSQKLAEIKSWINEVLVDPWSPAPSLVEHILCSNSFSQQNRYFHYIYGWLSTVRNSLSLQLCTYPKCNFVVFSWLFLHCSPIHNAALLTIFHYSEKNAVQSDSVNRTENIFCMEAEKILGGSTWICITIEGIHKWCLHAWRVVF